MARVFGTVLDRSSVRAALVLTHQEEQGRDTPVEIKLHPAAR